MLLKKFCFRKAFLIFLTLTCTISVHAVEGKPETKEQKESEKKTEVSIITIESAQKTENRKDPVNGGDCIILTGGVVISVERGSDKTTIKAENVNYNRTTEMIYAEGSVSLSTNKTSTEGGDSITASSLLFNTSSLEGIFDDGRIVQTSSDAINVPSGSTLIVASDIFGRDSSGTVTFKNGELTFCDDENPHWRIKASRIWLLPGGEFAFLNAFLFVGRIPLLWLPAFYYPKDELIFNPAFGFKSREGTFINTTTYLYGRKTSDAKTTSQLGKDDSDEDSDDKVDFFSFINTSAQKEQRREGLVLHNLDEDFTGSTSNYIKIMADYYAALGTMAGFDSAYQSSSGPISNFQLMAKLGWSRTIFQNKEMYSPFAASGETYSDEANFLSLKTKFRYQANLKFAISNPFTFSLSMPVYSDPYFDYDFNNRAETMDWIDYLTNISETSTAVKSDDEISEISSYNWDLNASARAPVTDLFSPFITTAEISSLNSSVVFSSLANSSISDVKDDKLSTYSPQRKFYYPSQVTPVKVTGKLAGTIIEIGSSSKTAKKSSGKKSPPDLVIPKSLTEDTEEKESDRTETNKSASQKNQKNPSTSQKEEAIFSESALPDITVKIPAATSISAFSYSLSYSITPTYTTQIAYSSTLPNSTDLITPDDFSWTNRKSTYYNVKVPTELASSAAWKDGFISLKDTFTFSPIFQDHPYLNNDFYTDSQKASVKKTDYAAQKLDLTSVNALSLNPFNYTQHFAKTAITWNSTVKMIRTEYTGTEDTTTNEINPDWDYNFMELWNEDSVTVHNLNLVLASEEYDGKFLQQLSLTSTLPPQPDEYTGELTLGFPYLTLTAGTGIKKEEATDDEKENWVKEDFKQTATLSLFSKKLKFSETYIYDMEEKYKESLKLSLAGFGLTASYTMSYTYGYDLTTDETTQLPTWTKREEQEFQPYSASVIYSKPVKTYKYWTDRIAFAPTISTNFVYSFIKPTESYFTIAPGITFKINNFLDISFSASSKNSSIYWYLKKTPDTSTTTGSRLNFFDDLANSFRFDDEEKRKSSRFKLQNLTVKITHDLDDWDLSSSFTIKPRLLTDNGKSYYDFSPYFTISVAWRPMSSMKTEITDNYGEWQLNSSSSSSNSSSQ